ncbi:uncharacterized protein METZ01_LOCUS67628 [marine metagenome]|uniref:Lysine transporter LysE n=1 Tax=marine metagenome TaxID=408172 RepID=A0A381TG77_9ZZZZ|tara:strand:+ start:1814 stop:2425 length:612 start_codon:yes stop_codon:yes gene_type:complete
MHLEVIITFIISSLALTISPGPDIVYVISQSFIRGKKAAIITSVGLTTGLLFHTLFVIIGLSLLLRENENIFFLLKILGSMYFIYLAFIVFLNRNKKIEFDSNEMKNIAFFKKGLLMNLLNPKVSIFFIALFPGFIFHDNLSSELQFLILGIIFWFQANLVFILVSIFSQKIKNFISSNKLFNNRKFIIEMCVYIFISIWILK